MQQLKNIYSKKHLTTSQCENSLEAFANDLNKNLIKAHKSPLQMLMGIMLKGEYNSIDPTFKTEEETVFEQQMQAKIAKANRMRELKQQAQEASWDIWLDQIGCIDITHAVSSLRRFSAAPRVGHLKRIERVYRYLNNWNNDHIRIDARPHIKIGAVQFKDAIW